MRPANHSIAIFTPIALAFAIAACSGKTPAPPGITPLPTGETITGAERIGWTQRASDAVDLMLIKYALYVDGTRSELAASCEDSALSADGFACSAKLPALTAGAHVLELVSFLVDGGVLESPRSAALRVTVAAIAVDADRMAARAADDGDWPAQPVITNDGLRLKVERLGGEFREPSGVAVAADGRL